jgi:hypothetical protein
MPPRFIVRRGHGEPRYSVWDTQKDEAAASDGRKCTDLDMDEAFALADSLNAPAQQQQQPQPKEDTKE